MEQFEPKPGVLNYKVEKEGESTTYIPTDEKIITSEKPKVLKAELPKEELWELAMADAEQDMLSSQNKKTFVQKVFGIDYDKQQKVLAEKKINDPTWLNN